MTERKQPTTWRLNRYAFYFLALYQINSEISLKTKLLSISLFFCVEITTWKNSTNFDKTSKTTRKKSSIAFVEPKNSNKKLKKFEPIKNRVQFARPPVKYLTGPFQRTTLVRVLGWPKKYWKLCRFENRHRNWTNLECSINKKYKIETLHRYLPVLLKTSIGNLKVENNGYTLKPCE